MAKKKTAQETFEEAKAEIEKEKPKSDYVEHMASYESKVEKKEKVVKPSEQDIALSNHPKFDKFK